MAVDITNLEPSQQVGLKTDEKSNKGIENASSRASNKSQSNTEDVSFKANQVDKLDTKPESSVRYTFRNVIEAKTLTNQAESGYKRISDTLNELRSQADEVLNNNYAETELYQAQYKFEATKNEFNKFLEDNLVRNQQFINRLNIEDSTFQINKDSINLTSNKEEEIKGFSTNTFQISDLNISNRTNAEEARNSLGSAIELINTRAEELNSAQNQLNDGLIDLLKNDDTEFKIENDDEALEETSSIAKLFLEEENNLLEIQANATSENYLQLLQE